MRGRFTPYILGVGLLSLAFIMLLFFAYALIARETVWGFLATFLAAGAAGGALLYLGEREAEPTRREALISVLLLWLVIPAFGAIPYVVSGGFSPLFAMFESMSGFTTTGATVLVDFTALTPSLFIYRALSQWIGGIGIIVIFIAVFPQLAIAGRQLFFAEAPGPTEERLTPRLRNTANAVLLLYTSLTILCGAAYVIVGMTPYEALAHALTTMAGGGFSPNPLSFEGYGPAMDWVAIVFMLFAGTNFALQYRVFSGRPRELVRDPEFRAYIIITLLATLLLVLALQNTYDGMSSLRHALFQTLSILTTTGYASVDFAEWPLQAQGTLMVLMFIGGSAGSAAGGVKVMRWLIISRNTVREVRRALHPRAVVPVRVGGRTVSEDVMRSVAAFITLYILLFAFTTVVLVWLGEDFTTALTASIACIGNIGPGLETVGPMANFADIHPVGLALLTFTMYAGRLEVITVFIVCNADFWDLPRRSLVRKQRRR